MPTLLVVAPWGKDAALIVNQLQRRHIAARAFANLDGLADAIDDRVGAVLVTEEALQAGIEPLTRALAQQPIWSDLPTILLPRPGNPSPTIARTLPQLGNVVLIDRPVRIATLVSTVRNALRARARQFETRAHLSAVEDADRRKDIFLATLSHELRNPLAPIRNVAELLQRSVDLPSRLKVPVDIVERQVRHLSRLVDDLLEISRVTRGAVTLRREPVLLTTLIHQAIESVEPQRIIADHRLAVVTPHEPVWLYADPVRMVQVITNLLDNAIKYTNSGGSIHLEVTADPLIEIRVRDSGIGIDADLLPRVFDLFSQLDTINRGVQAGLGIGLTLVRTLVEMHGGTVRAHSAGVGMGSTFVVCLPKRDADGAPVSAVP